MLQKGRVVLSLAGRDKDRLHVIMWSEGNRVAIADGKHRTLLKTKIKNTAHIRPTNTVLDMEQIATDKKLRRALHTLQARCDEGGY